MYGNDVRCASELMLFEHRQFAQGGMERGLTTYQMRSLIYLPSTLGRACNNAAQCQADAVLHTFRVAFGVMFARDTV